MTSYLTYLYSVLGKAYIKANRLENKEESDWKKYSALHRRTKIFKTVSAEATHQSAGRLLRREIQDLIMQANVRILYNCEY